MAVLATLLAAVILLLSVTALVIIVRLALRRGASAEALPPRIPRSLLLIALIAAVIVAALAVTLKLIG